jgi:hypothetical protein
MKLARQYAKTGFSVTSGKTTDIALIIKSLGIFMNNSG